MTAHARCQVLIVGAGPTGLSLACQCLRQGLRVRVIDKQPGPSTTSKAIGLQYRVSEILDYMGVADRFLARSGSPTNVNMYAGGDRLVTLRFSGFAEVTGQNAFAPRALMIPQCETEALLGELLRERGGQIEWDTSFVDFSQDAGRVVARLRRPDGREELVECDYLVSCEGAHSVIRKQAGLEFSGKTYPLAFLMADVEADWTLDHDENHVWFHQDGSFAALPLPRPRVWRLFVEISRQTNGSPNPASLEFVREVMAQRTGDRRTTLTNPAWISEFRVNCRMVDRYRVGRVLLAGDAAHIHSPTGGQGIATGIQDAINLAWKLGQVLRGAPDALLDTYQEERIPHAREVLRETDRTTSVFFAPTRAMRILRDRIVLPVLRNPRVQRRLFSKLSQLHVNYRESSLSCHQDSRRLPWKQTRIRAGDRAPDVAFTRAGSGQQTRLFELLGPMRPIVLLGAAGAATSEERLQDVVGLLGRSEIEAYRIVPPEVAGQPGGAGCLVDTFGDFRRIYGMSDEFLCLVRPDGHVGLFQRPVQHGALRTYLSAICAPTERQLA